MNKGDWLSSDDPRIDVEKLLVEQTIGSIEEIAREALAYWQPHWFVDFISHGRSRSREMTAEDAVAVVVFKRLGMPSEALNFKEEPESVLSRAAERVIELFGLNDYEQTMQCRRELVENIDSFARKAHSLWMGNPVQSYVAGDGAILYRGLTVQDAVTQVAYEELGELLLPEQFEEEAISFWSDAEKQVHALINKSKVRYRPEMFKRHLKARSMNTY